jgi:hypothetical protein
MTDFDRRRLVLAGAAVLLGTRSAIAQSGPTFTYRGIAVDASAAQAAPDIKDVVASLKHQIDIVVGCGAKPEIMTFFKSQPVAVKPGQGDGGGHFSSKVEGVTVDASVVPPEKPVLLHELLHAYHFRVLPGALQNPGLLLWDRTAERALPAGRLCAEERAGIFCRDGEPLSLGQCRPSAVQPHDAARQAAGLLSMAW